MTLARIRHRLSARVNRRPQQESGDGCGPGASARSSINLLPWREQERSRSNRLLAGGLAGALLAALLLVWAASWSVERRTGAQEQRNRLLEAENTALESRIEDARARKARHERALTRMAVVRHLRDSGSNTVRVFDALADTMVEGVHYSRIERRGDLLTAQGFAASNRLVSPLMRNIESSAQFTAAHLERLREEPHGSTYGPEASTFVMTFLQAGPVLPPGAGGEGAPGSVGLEG